MTESVSDILLVYASESMEAFAKKKGKVGTRGGGQIIKENDETLIFYRFVFLTKYIHGPFRIIGLLIANLSGT